MVKHLSILALLICIGQTYVTAQGQADTVITYYGPENPNIRYVGRGDFSNPKRPVFSAPAVYIQANFIGVYADVRFKDEYLYGQYLNNYSVIIDNQTVIHLQPSPSATDTIFGVVKDLAYGQHTITLIKRNESGVCKFTFLGFGFKGTIAPMSNLPTRKIQIFGNSISSGAANLPGTCPTWNEQIQHSDAFRAFGPIVARAFNADYHLTSVSGIGLVRNYSNKYDARPLPAIYNLVHLNDQTNVKRWNLNNFVPDVVLIELGTNDFSPGDSARPKMDTLVHKKAYISFIDTLKIYWPKAQYLIMGSPLLGDAWPDTSFHSRSDLIHVLTAVEQHYLSTKDTNVVYVPISKSNSPGCDGSHPSLQGQVDIAGQLAPVIVRKTGWPLDPDLAANGFLDPLGDLDWTNDGIISAVEDKTAGSLIELVLSPNPAEGEALVTWNTSGGFNLKIYDSKGTVVLERNGYGSALKMDISHWAQGLYSVVVGLDNKSQKTAKLMVK